LKGLCTLCFLVSFSGFASGDYQCHIESIGNPEGHGSARKFLESNFLDKTFTVDRSTGIMMGAIKNDYSGKPTVIDHGNKENSFKVLSTLPKESKTAGTYVTVLVVEEYSSSRRKPFTYMDNLDVLFGYCVDF
jgi:hypothetical protein